MAKKKAPTRKAGARKPPYSKQPGSAAAVRSVALKVPTKKAVSIAFIAEAPTFVKPRRIHPRRFLPRTLEGEHADAQVTSRRASVIKATARMMAKPQAATAEIGIRTNTEIASPAAKQTASNVGEPSVAVNGKAVLYTGNWYAAVSTDAGNTFQFLDPATAFQDHDPPGSSFCCDQVAQYIKAIDTFVWLLQYGPSSGDNLQRLAFAKTADLIQGKFRLFDITTKVLGTPGAFLDFPDIAVGANSLYVTTNVFFPDNTVGGAVVRIPLASISAGKVTAEPFVTTENDSLRVAQDCGKTAFFAAHADTSTLKVYSWKEGKPSPTSTQVSVAPWVGGNGYFSRTPDGRRWLDRADPRITGAAVAGNELWFAWGVDRGGANKRPNPYVQIARIDATTLELIENIDLFDTNSAICYAALCANSNGEVGMSYMIGGGKRFPSHTVGILTGTRKDVIVGQGARGPLPDENGHYEWGDYLTIRRAVPDEKLFAASGFTLQGGGIGKNVDATPRFVVFGRSTDL